MISIITPVWNKSELTNKFLFQHWQLYRNSPGVDLVVINNGSTDNTALVLGQWQEMMGKQLQVITNEENRGFGPANNQGAEIVNGDILVFLSNDVIISGDYLAPIMKIAKGILYGAQIFSHDTGWNTFDRIIPYVAGWCVVCHRDTWREIGGWDERYVPCDYEDIDLSLTAAQNGIELKQLNLPLYHLSGQSAQNLTGGRLVITLNNHALFKQKWGFV